MSGYPESVRTAWETVPSVELLRSALLGRFLMKSPSALHFWNDQCQLVERISLSPWLPSSNLLSLPKGVQTVSVLLHISSISLVFWHAPLPPLPSFRLFFQCQQLAWTAWQHLLVQSVQLWVSVAHNLAARRVLCLMFTFFISQGLLMAFLSSKNFSFFRWSLISVLILLSRM